MKDYITKLYEKLREAMEKPVTLGSAEEVGLYAKTIRRLEKLDCRTDEPDAAAFDRETAIHWAEHMQNADGSTGPHWTMEQTTKRSFRPLSRRRRSRRRGPPRTPRRCAEREPGHPTAFC